MAKIPVYEPDQISRPSSTGARPISDAPYRQIGDAVESFGNTMMKVADDIDRRDNKTAIAAANTELAKFSLEEYRNAQDTKTGSLALPDENTGYKGVYEDYNEKFAKKKQEIFAKYNISERFRDEADTRFEATANGYRDNFSAWQAVQKQAHQKDTVESNLLTKADEAAYDVIGGGTYDDLQIRINEHNQVIDDMFPNASPEALALTKQQNTAKITKSVLEAVIADDPRKGLALMKDERIVDVIPSNQLNTIKARTEKAALEYQASDDIFEIMEGTDNLADAMEVVNAKGYKDDPELRKKVVAGLRSEFAMKKAAEEDKYNSDLEEWWDKFDKSNDKRGMIAKDSTWMKHSDTAAAERELKRGITGDKVVTDPEIYNNLAMMSNDELKQENIMNYRNDLSPSDFKKWADRIRKAKNGGADKDLVSSAVKSGLTMAGNMLGAEGYKTGKKKSQAVEEIRMMLSKQIEQYVEETGKKPNAIEIRKMLGDSFTEVKVERDYWFDKNAKLFEIGYDDIPASDKTKIEAALIANGFDVSEENILMAYRSKLKQKSKRSEEQEEQPSGSVTIPISSVTGVNQ